MGPVSAEFEINIPVEANAAGSYMVSAALGTDAAAEFLVDTGANLSAISGELFERVKAQQEVVRVKRVATRLANGKLAAAQVYRVDTLRLANACDIAPFEFVVMKGAKRNLLGMSALAQIAPFAFHVAPAAIGVTRCQQHVLSDTSLASAAH